MNSFEMQNPARTNSESKNIHDAQQLRNHLASNETKTLNNDKKLEK